MVGIAFLSCFLTGPAFAEWGPALIGPRRLFLCSMTVMVAEGGPMFAMLDYVQDKSLFLGLSYLYRSYY